MRRWTRTLGSNAPGAAVAGSKRSCAFSQQISLAGKVCLSACYRHATVDRVNSISAIYDRLERRNPLSSLAQIKSAENEATRLIGPDFRE